MPKRRPSPDDFLNAAVPAPGQGHRDGDLDLARSMLRQNPGLATTNVYTAAITGNAGALKKFLQHDPALANQPGGVRGWPALCYLTFSRFLRIENRKRSEDFLAAAKILLDAGADPDGRWTDGFAGKPEVECALYGACGVANDAKITKLLLDRGARVGGDFENECLYHAAEFFDPACLKLILRRHPKDRMISYCMGHKMDMEDPAGLRLFLKFGGDPNFVFHAGQMKGWRQLHFAIDRGRSATIVKMLLNAGADPDAAATNGITPYAMAMRYGRRDIANLLLRNGAKKHLSDRDKLIAALAVGDAATARRLIAQRPDLIASLKPMQRHVMLPAARNGNVRAIRLMLDLGFDVNDQPNGWSPLHEAAWRGRASVVKLLVARGANPRIKNSYGGTALGTAMHAIVHGHHRPSISAAKFLLASAPAKDVRRLLKWAREAKNRRAVALLARATKRQ